jgi:COP9 signalosome complex subunit 4
LADLLESLGNWSEAASVLKGIPLDSGTRSIPDDYKVKIYIRIVRFYLEDEDSVSADAYLNRAVMLNPQDKVFINDQNDTLSFLLDYAGPFNCFTS